jgi:hypothetical protein
MTHSSKSRSSLLIGTIPILFAILPSKDAPLYNMKPTRATMRRSPLIQQRQPPKRRLVSQALSLVALKGFFGGCRACCRDTLKVNSSRQQGGKYEQVVV